MPFVLDHSKKKRFKPQRRNRTVHITDDWVEPPRPAYDRVVVDIRTGRLLLFRPGSDEPIVKHIEDREWVWCTNGKGFPYCIDIRRDPALPDDYKEPLEDGPKLPVKRKINR